jgi:hypothetical protein
MGIFGNALCRRYGAKDETLAYVVCECEALVALSHTIPFSCALRMLEVVSLGKS